MATREVVGYAMADHHRASLVVDALKMTHGRAELRPGCVIHSDRGSEYTSAEFRDEIRELDLRQGCERTGSCFDNAAAASTRSASARAVGGSPGSARLRRYSATRVSGSTPPHSGGAGSSLPSVTD
ncbi:DDE-type integrase/transposase/recombinase, partial [Streptomyces flaveus]|uniref:DDE-type integrase/transposase/recombinase n=1 Tax=Streptomyces flaveus TaxID=66370 RepID=UPI001FE7D02B